MQFHVLVRPPRKAAPRSMDSEIFPVGFPGCALVCITCERRKVMITPQRKRRSWILLLLLIPFIALLYPPCYNVKDPELIGIPFFDWFQLLLIIITSLMTAIVYFAGA